MALRPRLGTHECIQEYERAAREHQDAGLVLLADVKALGVALMGLSAEMALKAAYFRFVGYAATQQISAADLRAAVVDVQSLGVTDSPEGYHNLLFWANAVISSRRLGISSRSHIGIGILPAVAAAAMDTQNEVELRTRAMRLRTNWSIGDRYKSIQPHAAKQDLEDVFDDAVLIVELYDKRRI